MTENPFRPATRQKWVSQHCVGLDRVCSALTGSISEAEVFGTSAVFWNEGETVLYGMVMTKQRPFSVLDSIRSGSKSWVYICPCCLLHLKCNIHLHRVVQVKPQCCLPVPSASYSVVFAFLLLLLNWSSSLQSFHYVTHSNIMRCPIIPVYLPLPWCWGSPLQTSVVVDPIYIGLFSSLE